MKKVKLQYDSTTQKYQNPLLVSFPQNMPLFLDNLNLQSYTKKGQNMLHGQNEIIELYSKNQQKSQNCKYLIGIEENNQIQLYDASGVYSMNQKINKDVHEVAENKYQNLTHREKKQILVEEFGTKKSKKKLQQMQNNQVDENNISGTQEIKQILIDKAHQIQEDVQQKPQVDMKKEIQMKREFLPDFNLEAQKVSKIYDVTSIISSEELNCIDISHIENYISAQNPTSKDKYQYCEYVNYLVYHNQYSQLKLKYLCYLNIMIRLVRINQVSKSLQEFSEEQNTNQLLLKNLLNKFYQAVPNSENNTVKYVRPSSQYDKFICHIIVLALIINDFKMDGWVLSQNLKSDIKRFVQYCKEVGCTVTKSESDNKTKIMMELKAPLKIQFNKITGKKKQ